MDLERKPAPEILIVEDDSLTRNLLSKTLKQLDFQVREAENGRAAWNLIEREGFQLVITDWLMPEMDGLELTRTIRSAPLPHYVYIIILTSLDGIDNVIDGLDAGADDYLTKPFDPRELHARLKIGRRILELEHNLNRAHEQMRHLAMHDELTGLWNRRAFYNHAAAELERAARENTWLGMILLDIDHFKSVNDRFGHLVGDQALKMVARTLKANLRQYDRVGRWGGEEFIVLLPSTTPEEALEIAERLREDVAQASLPVVAEGNEPLRVKISLGVACTQSGEGMTIDTLVDRADEMLYQAKEGGRNQTRLYSSYEGLEG